jgi:hypothetical protein
MNVRLHIERLVIEGIDVPNRKALQAAVEGELGRLIGEGGLGANGLESERVVQAPMISVASNPHPANLGRAIAGAVYGGVGRRPA